MEPVQYLSHAKRASLFKIQNAENKWTELFYNNLPNSLLQVPGARFRFRPERVGVVQLRAEPWPVRDPARWGHPSPGVLQPRRAAPRPRMSNRGRRDSAASVDQVRSAKVRIGRYWLLVVPWEFFHNYISIWWSLKDVELNLLIAYLAS